MPNGVGEMSSKAISQVLCGWHSVGGCKAVHYHFVRSYQSANNRLQRSAAFLGCSKIVFVAMLPTVISL